MVPDMEGYSWTHASSDVDSGPINSVAPPEVSSVRKTESQDSVCSPREIAQASGPKKKQWVNWQIRAGGCILSVD